MSEPIIELRDVKKVFDDGTVAVRHMNLEIAEGEFLCILGPTGCGKTTTLRIITGLETPTEGNVYLRGERVTDWPPQRRNIGLMFQRYALFTHMSVYENLSFAPRMRGVPPNEYDDRVRGMAAELQLEEVLEARAGGLDLSSMQRVAMGRTLLAEPPIMLLDEPLNNFDPGLRESMRAELKRWQDQFGTTMVYVTHDQEEALTLGDRILVMRNAEAEQIGTPPQIYRRPETLFVAGFIGRPSMNFLEASVAENVLELQGGVRVELDRIGLPRRDLPLRLMAGIRPEYLVPNPGGDLCRLEGVVDLIRPQAAKTIVDIKVGEQTLFALVPSPYRSPLGEAATFGFDPDHLALFDKQTGRAIR